MLLPAVEARLLGALVEKQLTTPQQYPLTISALVMACNQATNRDPVVQYDESTVLAGIDELKQMKLARSVLPSHGRSATRYRHILPETWALLPGQCALVAVMLLRGPQTVSELRIRTERLAEIDDVGQELEWLASRNEPLLAVNLGRRPGQKEERWACPLLAIDESAPPTSASSWVDESPDSLADLEAHVAALQSEVNELRQQLIDLKVSLGE
ncbi:MAG TPA: DUF480 domain-containing protein [Acidimicrobiales bacterium]|jgi:hypothetical protein